MSYTIERKSNPPVYITTLNEDFDTKTELLQYRKELGIAINKETKPIAIIMDMSNLSISLTDLLTSTMSSKT